MKRKRNLAIEESYSDTQNKIHSAVQNDDLKAIKYFASLTPPLNIDGRDKYGYTPLELAASEGYAEICKFLIEKGANVNSISNEGTTPLYQAIHEAESLEIVKLLLENGADPNLLCGTGDGTGDLPLELACRKDQIEIVEELIKHGAKVNSLDGAGCSALATAVATEKPDIVKLLLKNGADIKKGRLEGLNILELSKECRDPETQKIITKEILKKKILKELSSKEHSIEI